MSWKEAAKIVRRWADISDAAARDRGVSQQRLRVLRSILADLPDKDAAYVLRNELVGKAMGRLADMFEQQDFDSETTPVVAPDWTEPNS